MLNERQFDMCQKCKYLDSLVDEPNHECVLTHINLNRSDGIVFCPIRRQKEIDYVLQDESCATWNELQKKYRKRSRKHEK